MSVEHIVLAGSKKDSTISWFLNRFAQREEEGMHPLICLVPPFRALLGACRDEMDGKKQFQQFAVFVGDKTLS